MRAEDNNSDHGAISPTSMSEGKHGTDRTKKQNYDS